MRFVAFVSFVSLVSLVSFVSLVSLCWLVRQIGRFSRGASYSRNGLLILHYVLFILMGFKKRGIERGLFASIPVVILVEFIFSAPFLNATLTVRSCSR